MDVRRGGSVKLKEDSFDDIPLPVEVQRDLNPILPKSKFNMVVFSILVLVLILCGGLIYLFFFTDNSSFKIPTASSSKTNTCSIVDISVSSLSANTCYEQNESTLKVFVERGDNSYSLKSFIFNLYSSSGKKMTYISNQVLQENGKNTYVIKYSSILDVKKFEVIPTIQENGTLKNCSRLVVSSVYPCKLSESSGSFADTGINISYSANNSSNVGVLTNVSSNTTNNSVNLGGSSGYTAGGSTPISTLNSSNSSTSANSSANTSSNNYNSSTTYLFGSISAGSFGSISRTCVSYPSISISTCQDLQNMQNNLCGSYYLTKDIDCSATRTWNSGLGFIPVGADMEDIFAGVLDGKGYKISNLFINRSDENNVGLFGYSQGNITNLGLINVDITGDWATGAFVGEQYYGKLFKVYSTGKIIGNNLVGGLIGGFSFEGIVSQSYSSASVFGEANVGGLIGGTSEGSEVVNCYSTGSVTADNTVGGFIGSSGGFVSNSYSTGLVTGDTFVDLDVGGFVGFASGIGEITNCYFDKQTSGQDLDEYDSDTPQGEPRTTSQMKAQSNYVGWDFTNVWKMSGYPVFK